MFLKKLSWLKGSLLFLFYVFVLILFFLFLVLSVCNLNNEVALFCVCVVCSFFVNKTKCFSGLHLVVLFIFGCFVFDFWFSGFSFHSKRDQKPDTAKKTKNQKYSKGDKIKSVSAVVFINSVPNLGGWATKMLLFDEKPFQKTGFSIF